MFDSAVRKRYDTINFDSIHSRPKLRQFQKFTTRRSTDWYSGVELFCDEVKKMSEFNKMASRGRFCWKKLTYIKHFYANYRRKYNFFKADRGSVCIVFASILLLAYRFLNRSSTVSRFIEIRWIVTPLVSGTLSPPNRRNFQHCFRYCTFECTITTAHYKHL